MRTLEDLYDYASTNESQCLDGRDYLRMACFFPQYQLPLLGVALKPGEKHHQIALTEEIVLQSLKEDVAFGFTKALDKRGISSYLMFEVVRMWLFILGDDELRNASDGMYPNYGLPFLKAVALKYNFENPIGDDQGNEDKYAGE